MSYRNRDQLRVTRPRLMVAMTEIAANLGVRAILGGRCCCRCDVLYLNRRLRTAEDGSFFWSGYFDQRAFEHGRELCIMARRRRPAASRALCLRLFAELKQRRITCRVVDDCVIVPGAIEPGFRAQHTIVDHRRYFRVGDAVTDDSQSS
jgi:hypothetical protein